MDRLLIFLAIFVLGLELNRLLRGYWIRRILKKKNEAKQPRKPRVMRPKSERDCPFYMKKKGRLGSLKTGKMKQSGVCGKVATVQ